MVSAHLFLPGVPRTSFLMGDALLTSEPIASPQTQSHWCPDHSPRNPSGWSWGGWVQCSSELLGPGGPGPCLPSSSCRCQSEEMAERREPTSVTTPAPYMRPRASTIPGSQKRCSVALQKGNIDGLGSEISPYCQSRVLPQLEGLSICSVSPCIEC